MAEASEQYQFLLAKVTGQPPIEFEVGPVLEEEIAAFRIATLSTFCPGIPPTFATRFRKGEFEWLERGQVNMRQLLHTEQGYEYFSEIKAGETLSVSSWVESIKEKRGLIFATIVSTIRSGGLANRLAEGRPLMKSTTTFVLRTT